MMVMTCYARLHNHEREALLPYILETSLQFVHPICGQGM